MDLPASAWFAIIVVLHLGALVRRTLSSKGHAIPRVDDAIELIAFAASIFVGGRSFWRGCRLESLEEQMGWLMSGAALLIVGCRGSWIILTGKNRIISPRHQAPEDEDALP